MSENGCTEDDKESLLAVLESHDAEHGWLMRAQTELQEIKGDEAERQKVCASLGNFILEWKAHREREEAFVALYDHENLERHYCEHTELLSELVTLLSEVEARKLSMKNYLVCMAAIEQRILAHVTDLDARMARKVARRLHGIEDGEGVS